MRRKTEPRTRRTLSLRNSLLLIVTLILILQAIAAAFSVNLGRRYALQEQFDAINSDYTRIATALTAKNSMIESLMDTLSYLYSIRDVLHGKSIFEDEEDHRMLLRVLNSYTDLDRCIDSVSIISLTDEDDFIYQFYSAMADYNRMIQHAVEKVGFSDWAWLSGKRIFTISEPIYVGNTMDYPAAPKAPQGISIFFINLDVLLEEIGLFDVGKKAQFLLLNDQGRLLYNPGGISGEMQEYIAGLVQTIEEPMGCLAKVEGVDYTFYGGELGPMKWKLVGYAPTANSNALYREVTQPMLMIWVGMAALTIALVAFVVISLYRFVSRMLRHMELMREGVWDQPMKSSKLKEFAAIADNFDAMMMRISRLHTQNIDIQKRLMNQEINKRQILLMALQAQINPHFLYNTLECIKSIGVYYGISEIPIIAQSLAYMFKYSIKNSAMATIRDEVECVQNYMAIQNIRFDARFQLHISINAALEEVSIPRMLFQPLVENALKHGLEGKSGDGNVWLDVDLDEEKMLRIIVRDDGKGISAERLHALRRQLSGHDGEASGGHGSIGLANISERLYLRYDGLAQMEIECGECEGTTIRIRIPVGKEELACTE